MQRHLAMGAVALLVTACSSSEAPTSRPGGPGAARDAGTLVDVAALDEEEGGIRAYRLAYLTAAVEKGAPVRASGLLLVPDEITSDVLVSYQHSSAVARDDVPTVGGTPHRDAAVALARSGRVVVAADYLGLGVSDGPHPWLDADSEATATADFLTAASQALTELDEQVPTRVDLVGFSQGAHATMALARSLTTRSDSLAVRSIVGIAGPYRLDVVDVPALVGGESDPTVRSLALARLVYTAAVLGHDVEGMFVPRGRLDVRRLFDGTHTDVDVVTALPEGPEELFTEAGWTELQDAGSVFGRWLRTTSAVCDGWTTDATISLLHAHGDTSALPANSALCRDQLVASGSSVTLTDLGDLEHIASGEVGIEKAVAILAEADAER